MIVAEYGTEGEFMWRRFVVDTDQATVTFHRCHVPKRFFSFGVDSEFTCPLSELRWTRRSRASGLGWLLEVVTPSGRAMIPERASGFEEMKSALIAGLAPDARQRWYQYTYVQAVAIFFVCLALSILVMAAIAFARLGPIVLVVLIGFIILVPAAMLIAKLRGRPLG
jgi:hypothetical protein